MVRMIISANVNYFNLKPIAIGIANKFKVNINIFASLNALDAEEQVNKLKLTVMDLSTGGVKQVKL